MDDDRIYWADHLVTVWTLRATLVAMTDPLPPMPEPGSATFPTHPPAPARRRRTWLYVAAAAVGVVIAIVLIVASNGAKPSGPTDDDRMISACHEGVKDKLRAPSTATFVGDDVVTRPGGDQPFVSGSVDAENGFSAMIRGTFRCDMAHNSDGSWNAYQVNLSS